MFSNTSDRSGLKKGKDTLRLKKSLRIDSSVREETVEDLRAAAEESADPELWIDDHFQCILKNLVRSLVDAENQLYGLQDRRQRLKSNRCDGKVPSGLKIRNITAKGKNAKTLQQKFNDVLKEAELKLLDATVEALQIEEQQFQQRCTEEKQKVLTAIENWRSSFKRATPLWTSRRTNSSYQRNLLRMTFTSNALQNGLLSKWRSTSKKLQKPQRKLKEWRQNLP